MKTLGKMVIGVVAVLLIAGLAKNLIAQAVVSAGVKAITGLSLQMQSLSVGVARPLVIVRGLRLFNPRGFPDRVMVDLPELYVDYDLGALLKRQIHLREARLRLREFQVVKNRDGALNLDALTALQQAKQPEQAKTKAQGAAPSLQIDALELQIGTVVYKDYSEGGEPTAQAFEINLHERYENITNPTALASLIVVKALAKTTIARLANVDLGALKGVASDALKSGTAIASETLGAATRAAQEVGGKATATVQEVGGKAAREATEGLKKLLPFGGGQ